MPKIYSAVIIELTNYDEDFIGFTWMLKAVPFDPDSSLDRTINIEKDTVIGTDGHRLHIYNSITPNYPTGVFKVLSHEVDFLAFAYTDDTKFPDYQKAIPDYTQFKELVCSGHVEIDYATVIWNVKSQAFNFRYFSDANDNMTKMYAGSGKEPVILEGDRRMALVMPMRVQ